MSTDITAELQKTKQAGYLLAQLDDARRNSLLQTLANKLRDNYEDILAENAKDTAKMSIENPIYDRLLLTKERIFEIAKNIEAVIALPSVLNKKIAEKTMPNGLRIEKITVPIGVIGIIYESRPNVTIDVFTLCFKTGNACVLKGGKEAEHSNKILIAFIHKALLEHHIDPHVVYLLPSDRQNTQLLLTATGLVDVCIPRGSQNLINFVRENAKIPVIETGAGIVHLYFDASGDISKGQLIINNSKTRRISVCNALDCLIIHANRLNDLFSLVEPMLNHNVEIFADNASYAALEKNYPKDLLHHAEPKDFGQEFLAYKLAIKTVSSAEQAVQHIMQHTSGHSEGIIAEDPKIIGYFLNHIDAAVVYINASTAFTDGGEFGMGAEIGISTQKLHARGPMGLDALTSYKWIVHGDGQIRD